MPDTTDVVRAQIRARRARALAESPVPKSTLPIKASKTRRIIQLVLLLLAAALCGAVGGLLLGWLLSPSGLASWLSSMGRQLMEDLRHA